jgi:surface polysaccharide O-acyltransferase-like enzyme
VDIDEAICDRDVNERLAMKTNYAAVFVSALAYWILGALWYGLLFSKPWMALENISMESAKAMNPVLPYVVTFALNLLIAFVLAQICIWRSANTAARGVALGIFLWIGFVGPVTFTTYMYEMRSMQLFAINEFYPLVGFCLMGGILGAWTKKAA